MSRPGERLFDTLFEASFFTLKVSVAVTIATLALKPPQELKDFLLGGLYPIEALAAITSLLTLPWKVNKIRRRTPKP